MGWLDGAICMQGVSPSSVLLQEIPSHTLPKVPATCPTKSGPQWKLTITLSTFPTTDPVRLPVFQGCSSGGPTKAATLGTEQKWPRTAVLEMKCGLQFSGALEVGSKN